MSVTNFKVSNLQPSIVGIGTTAPVCLLDLFTSLEVNAPLLSLRSSLIGTTHPGAHSMIRFGDQNQTTLYQKGAIIYEGVDDFTRGKFHVALEGTAGNPSVALADAKLTVQYNGNVGIGVTAPGFSLTISNALTGIDATQISYSTTGDGGQGAQFGMDTTNKYTWWRLNSSTNYGFAIQSVGKVNLVTVSNAGVVSLPGIGSGAGTYALKWTTTSGLLTYDTSSEKYKKNIRSIFDTSRIYDINIKLFDRKDDGTIDDFGPIAEQVYEVFPELAVVINNVPDGVKEGRAVWILLEEMKKLNKTIDSLQNRINVLEGNAKLETSTGLK